MCCQCLSSFECHVFTLPAFIYPTTTLFMYCHAWQLRHRCIPGITLLKIAQTGLKFLIWYGISGNGLDLLMNIHEGSPNKEEDSMVEWFSTKQSVFCSLILAWDFENWFMNKRNASHDLLQFDELGKWLFCTFHSLHSMYPQGHLPLNHYKSTDNYLINRVANFNPNNWDFMRKLKEKNLFQFHRQSAYP